MYSIVPLLFSLNRISVIKRFHKGEKSQLPGNAGFVEHIQTINTLIGICGYALQHVMSSLLSVPIEKLKQHTYKVSLDQSIEYKT